MTKPALDRLPPHSPEAEQGVLGCILQAPDECLDDCILRLPGPQAFFDLRHKTIYEMLVEMHQAGRTIDTITLHQTLKDRNAIKGCGGLEYISKLPDMVPSAANLEYYVEILIAKFLARERIGFYAQFTADLYESDGDVAGMLDSQEQKIIGDWRETNADGIMDAVHSLHTLTDHLEERFRLHCAGQRSGLATGFYRLDAITDGLQPGEMTVIAARPSVGKTAIGMNLVERICLRDGFPTLVVSCEMSRNALLRRMLSGWTAFPMSDLKSGAYTDADFQKFMAFQIALKRAPLFIMEALGGIDCDRLSGMIRRVWRKHGIKFVVLDYLQKVRASGHYEKRTYELAEASGMIKSILQQTGIAGVILAQLNRESDRDKGRMPRMSDLADCGRIEQDADTIGLLHRDRQESAAKLIIAKQRDGNVGSIDLEFIGQYCRFQNAAIGEENNP